MCDHQAGSACFVGHRWGRGCRDAAQNLLQTSTIDLGGFPLRRICGTERSTTFFFLIPPSESFQVGDSRWWVGGGVEEREEEKKKTPNKQTKTRAAS